MPDGAPSIFDAKAAYYATVGYDGPGGSVTMATQFIQACRVLLVVLSKHVSHGGRAEEQDVDQTILERQIAAAQRWVYSQNVRQNGQNVRIFRRGEPFVPVFPGPYYG